MTSDERESRRKRGNWLVQERYFWSRLALEPLGADAVSVWHYMAWRSNAVFWTFPIRLSLGEICGALRISETSFKRARNELSAGGYLYHFAVGGRAKGEYILLDTQDGEPYGTIRKVVGTLSETCYCLSGLKDAYAEACASLGAPIDHGGRRKIFGRLLQASYEGGL